MSLTINGSNLKLYVNAFLVGIVTSFSFSIDYGRRTITGIDVQTPVEITSGQVKVKGQMSIVRLQLDGGAEGYGLIPKISDISLEKYISITLVDRFTDAVVFNSDYAVVGNQSWSIKNRQIVTGTVNFECIGYVNELGSGVGVIDTNFNFPRTQ
jgi:hypothetical protein